MVREYISTLLVAVILGTFARTFLVQAYAIPSRSMEPGLLVGDHILVNKFIYGWDRLGDTRGSPLLPTRGVRRGDVVVFQFPPDPRLDFIKRCVALPGEAVRIEASTLRIDRRVINETGYARKSGATGTYGPFTVPLDHYFCLGDNRDRSNDSRSWGPVPRRLLRGRAIMIYWSVETAVQDSGTWDRMGSSLPGIARWLLPFRWTRSFRLVR